MFFGLPEEIIGSIVDYLDISDLCKLSSVSKQYAKVANDDKYWKNRYFEFLIVSGIAEVQPANYKQALVAETRKMYKHFKPQCFEHADKILKEEAKQTFGCSFVPIERILASEPVLLETNIKCVVVGDGGVGKTCSLIAACTDQFPEDYVPTVFDNYNANCDIGGTTFSISLWDTAGQEDYDRLRPLSYPGTNLFLLYFTASNPHTFENLASRWVVELTHHCPGVPVVLVGARSDVRYNEQSAEHLAAKNKAFITRRQGEAMARKLGCLSYFEMSAKEFRNTKNLMQIICQAAGYSQDGSAQPFPASAKEAAERITRALSARHVYPKLIEIAEYLCKEEPGFKSYMKLGCVLYQSNNKDKAFAAFQKAEGYIDQASNQDSLKSEASKLYRKLSKTSEGNPAVQISYVTKWIQRFEAFIAKKKQTVHEMIEANQFSEASELLLDLNTTYAKMSTYYNIAYEAYIKLDENEKAFEQARKMLLCSENYSEDAIAFVLEYALEHGKFEIIDQISVEKFKYPNSRLGFAAILLLLIAHKKGLANAEKFIASYQCDLLDEEDNVKKANIDEFADDISFNLPDQLKFLAQATSCLVLGNAAIAKEAFENFGNADIPDDLSENEASYEIFLSVLETDIMKDAIAKAELKSEAAAAKSRLIAFLNKV